ncbi:hypothetical protein FQN54_000481 [Arachnomyces sp. PD_36]|nr:hypothetical protein FQN54_000481 [Arachnomyces sp. PD_36]
MASPGRSASAVIPKLTRDNYREWSSAVMYNLIGLRAWDVVTGDEVEPIPPQLFYAEADEEKFKQEHNVFKDRFSTAISVIYGAVPKEHTPLIAGILSPKDMWQKLKQAFDLDMNPPDLYKLHQAFNAEKFNPAMDTVMSWSGRLQSHARKLASSDWPLDQRDVIHKLISELPVQYEVVRQLLYKQNPRELQVDVVVRVLQSAEPQMAQKPPPPPAAPAAGTASTAPTPGPGKKKKNKEKADRKWKGRGGKRGKRGKGAQAQNQPSAPSQGKGKGPEAQAPPLTPAPGKGNGPQIANKPPSNQPKGSGSKVIEGRVEKPPRKDTRHCPACGNLSHPEGECWRQQLLPGRPASSLSPPGSYRESSYPVYQEQRQPGVIQGREIYGPYSMAAASSFSGGLPPNPAPGSSRYEERPHQGEPYYYYY